MKKLTFLILGAATLAISACAPTYDRYGYRDYYGQRDYYGYADRDRDGVPNRYDRDRDNDGVPNYADRNPNNPYRY